jgi:hypothetical protein
VIVMITFTVREDRAGTVRDRLETEYTTPG